MFNINHLSHPFRGITDREDKVFYANVPLPRNIISYFEVTQYSLSSASLWSWSVGLAIREAQSPPDLQSPLAYRFLCEGLFLSPVPIFLPFPFLIFLHLVRLSNSAQRMARIVWASLSMKTSNGLAETLGKEIRLVYFTTQSVTPSSSP